MTIYRETFERLHALGKGVTYLSKVHRRSRQRIYQAFRGEAEELFQKIIKHIEKLELNKSESK